MNGKVLEPSERVELATQGQQTTLDIPFSVRSDSGQYTLTLTNDHGSDSATATVTVLGNDWGREYKRLINATATVTVLGRL